MELHGIAADSGEEAELVGGKLQLAPEGAHHNERHQSTLFLLVLHVGPLFCILLLQRLFGCTGMSQDSFQLIKIYIN
jgi:hypothetical protein